MGLTCTYIRHHMLHAVNHVSGRVLWANLHLLFWLSLIPFVSGWMGENHFATVPVACYGLVLLMCGLAYTILAYCLTHGEHTNPALAEAIGKDWKGKASTISYIAGIGLSCVHPLLGFAVYVGVALLWLVPDPRIEKHMHQ